jgi:xanthine dehydrogenase accessory factor
MQISSLRTLNAAQRAGRPIVRAIELSTYEERLVEPGFADHSQFGEACRSAARADHSGSVEIDGQVWFLCVFNPRLELVIVGAVHIAQILAHMAILSDYDVRIIDPRAAFATAERFPGMDVSVRWPEEELAERPPGPRSAVVALSHDPKLDDPALAAALRSTSFYVGALGSSRSHAARLARLRDNGMTEAQLDRIHGPVGLNLGARGPSEIAVSILAEITATLRLGGAPVDAARRSR